ncbi:MAG: hypothetical protein GY865_08315, partial [candidate division Zixibacteria bacterium]|nr:hypothetical protein [candidate division Zixibacteria bacterium]
EATCGRVLIINEGQIVADGTPTELQSSFEGKGRIIIQVKNNLDSFVEKSTQVAGIERIVETITITENLKEVDFETVKGIDPREDIFRLCIENQTVMLEMKREETSLEDVFRQLTGKEQMQ